MAVPRLLVAAIFASLTVSASACGGDQPTGSASAAAARSPESYCEAFYSRAAPLRQKYQSAADEAQSDPLAAIPALLSSGGDLAVVFDGMIPHAPPEIEPETVAVRDALKRLQQNLVDNATDPAAALASNVVNALTSSGSFQAVNDYLQVHCPLSSALASKYVQRPAAPSPSGSATQPPVDAAAPADGTVMTTFTGTGRINVITSGRGFSIVDSSFDLAAGVDHSTITSYDVAGNKLAALREGALTGECGAADISVPGNGRLLVAYLVNYSPAQGIRPEHTSTQILAWDATSGTQVWSHPLSTNFDCQAYDGNLQGFAATPDGRWALVGREVFDLADGSVRRDPKAMGIIGNYVIDTSNVSWGNDSPTFLVTDPASGDTLGNISNDGTADGTRSGHQDGQISFEGTNDLAPRGFFYTDSDGSSPRAGTSSTGRILFANPAYDGSSQGPYIFTYALPSMRVMWKTAKSFQPYIVGDGGGVLVMTLEDCTADGSSCVVGVDDRTGHRLWKLPEATVCGVTDSEMLLHVNDQSAVVDVKTGRQLSYSNSSSDGCPSLLLGGIAMGSDANYGDPTATQSVTVTQVLQP